MVQKELFCWLKWGKINEKFNSLTKLIETLNISISEDKEQFAILLSQINNEK